MNEQTADINRNVYRKPRRTFEKSGLVNPETSYYVDLENVVNTNHKDIKTMIDLGRYFSIFAPRQSGKTNFLKETCRRLHHDPTYVAILLSFQGFNSLDKPRFYALIEKYLYAQLIDRLKQVNCEKIEAVRQFLDNHHLADHIDFKELFEGLNRILLFKKIVIFIDEFDDILMSELENFLNALRAMYHDYKSAKQKAFYSVGLIGIRNITKLVVSRVSPYNIADHVDLPPFSLKNVRDLYAQYTAETNQPFTEEAVKKVYGETGGQPWLVNRLGTILTVNVKPGTVEPIDEKDVDKAIQLLLDERNDHFDNLYEKAKLYKETFVEIVFDHIGYHPYDEEQSWLEQYGLIKNKEGHAVVANNIYKGVIVKAFFREAKALQEVSLPEYTLPVNRLDIERILVNFNQYIAQIGVRAFYQEDKPYEKTGQFLLTAWLYPFIKGGERELQYEVHSGWGRIEILLTYKGQRYIIETKVNRSDDITVILEEGIKQVAGKYLTSEGLAAGYLVIFDPRSPVGASCKPQYHGTEDRKVTSFIIAIGRKVAPHTK
ncbi:MAG TPA: AAA-like domain-containing protein, partial [Candidatus Kapabacteria bacterium]|nr:AAA-like domain-containing protein [Candidatus Kapabacteria bacterium]